MAPCSIRWCGKSSKMSSLQKDGITFHRFPRDADVKLMWIIATHREDWYPTINSVVCSRHFTEDSFFTVKCRRRLLRSAVPTLYLPLLASSVGVGPSTPSTSSAPAQPNPNVVKKDVPKKNTGRQAKKRKVEPIYEDFDSDDGLASDELDQTDPAAASPAAPASLCCCCLAATGCAALVGAAPDAEEYADMLSYCFDITYPAELRMTATICSDCAAKLNDGVMFKRRALECYSLLSSQATDVTATEPGTKPAESEVKETYNIILEGEDEFVVIKEEPTEAEPASELLTIDDDTAHIVTRSKIEEEYDLSTSNGDQLFGADADGEPPVDANEHVASPIFQGTDITEDDVIAQTWFKVTPYDTKRFQYGCKCGKNCFNLFNQSEVIAFRRECEMYNEFKCDTHHMDVFLTGILACIVDRTAPKCEVHFKFRNVPICEEFFKYIFAINQTQYNIILSKIMDRDKYQWTSKSISDQPFAIKFLKVFSNKNSLVLPGRFSNKHPDLHILPKNVTKTTIYSEYARVCVANKHRCVNQIIWEKLWERFCPHIVHKMPSDLCKTCRENKKLLIAAVMNKALSTKILQHCLEHLKLVMEEREFYQRSMVKTSIGDGSLHCSVDHLQRIRLSLAPDSNSVKCLDTYGVALLAVASRPPGETVVYVVPECVGDDTSNILLSLLHHFLESNGTRDVQWHCGPLLRAHCVLQYAAWRAARAAGRCRLAFLPPGHDRVSQFDCLTLLKIALRNRPARCIQDLCDVLASLGVTAIPVATENGALKLPLFNWVEFFNAKNPVPVANIQDYCHFEAVSSDIGAIKCKVSATSEEHDVKTIFECGSLSGAPAVLRATGLPSHRRDYLNKVKPHLDESEVLIEYQPNQAQDPLEFIKEEVKMEFEEHPLE